VHASWKWDSKGIFPWLIQPNVMIRAIRVLRTRLWTSAGRRAKQIDANNINTDNLRCLWWCLPHFIAVELSNDGPAGFLSNLLKSSLRNQILCCKDGWRACADLLMDFWRRTASEIYYPEMSVWYMTSKSK
jgi:hypothetical protein